MQVNERDTTFFDLPSHLREIIWKHARRLNVEEGCERLVAPLQTKLNNLQLRMNQELVSACGSGDTNTLNVLLQLGADPTSNNAEALIASVISDEFTSLGYLLLLKPYPFDNPEMKPHLKRAFILAVQNSTITHDSKFVDRLREHYKYAFSGDIANDI